MMYTLEFVVDELNEKMRAMVFEVLAFIVLAILTIWAFIKGDVYCVGFATIMICDIIGFATSFTEYKYYEQQLKEHVEFEEQLKN